MKLAYTYLFLYGLSNFSAGVKKDCLLSGSLSGLLSICTLLAVRALSISLNFYSSE